MSLTILDQIARAKREQQDFTERAKLAAKEAGALELGIRRALENWMAPDTDDISASAGEVVDAIMDDLPGLIEALRSVKVIPCP